MPTLLDSIILILIGALITIITTMINHYLSLYRDKYIEGRDKQRYYWDKWIDSIINVERKAGLLMDNLTGISMYDDNMAKKSKAIYYELEEEKAIFYRKQKLRDAISEFNNSVAILLTNWGKWNSIDERKNQIDNLNNTYKKLITELDVVRRS
jgi:hypothetical protein